MRESNFIMKPEILIVESMVINVGIFKKWKEKRSIYYKNKSVYDSMYENRKKTEEEQYEDIYFPEQYYDYYKDLINQKHSAREALELTFKEYPLVREGIDDTLTNPTELEQNNDVPNELDVEGTNTQDFETDSNMVINTTDEISENNTNYLDDDDDIEYDEDGYPINNEVYSDDLLDDAPIPVEQDVIPTELQNTTEVEAVATDEVLNTNIEQTNEFIEPAVSDNTNADSLANNLVDYPTVNEVEPIIDEEPLETYNDTDLSLGNPFDLEDAPSVEQVENTDVSISDNLDSNEELTTENSGITFAQTEGVIPDLSFEETTSDNKIEELFNNVSKDDIAKAKDNIEVEDKNNDTSEVLTTLNADAASRRLNRLLSEQEKPTTEDSKDIVENTDEVSENNTELTEDVVVEAKEQDSNIKQTTEDKPKIVEKSIKPKVKATKPKAKKVTKAKDDKPKAKTTKKVTKQKEVKEKAHKQETNDTIKYLDNTKVNVVLMANKPNKADKAKLTRLNDVNKNSEIASKFLKDNDITYKKESTNILYNIEGFNIITNPKVFMVSQGNDKVLTKVESDGVLKNYITEIKDNIGVLPNSIRSKVEYLVDIMSVGYNSRIKDYDKYLN